VKRKLLLLVSGIFAVVFIYFALGYVVAYQSDDDCLPEHLKWKIHCDYFWFKKISRIQTSRCLVYPPILVLGKNFKPIPKPGQWQFSFIQVRHGSILHVFYFALTLENLFHVRAGTRLDDIDHYYTLFSLAAKDLKKTRQTETVFDDNCKERSD